MNRKRYRIALVSDDFSPPMTGAGFYLRGFAEYLVGRGHHVVVITSNPWSRERCERGVAQVYRGFTLRLFGIDQAFFTPGQIRKILHQETVDIVHHHFLSGLTDTVSRVAKEMRVPQVYTHHMSIELLSQHRPLRPMKPIFFAMYKHFLARMNRIITPSSRVMQTMHRDGIRVPMEHISNPILLPMREPPAGDRTTPPGGDGFSVLYAGRLAPEKNVELLLRGFAELAKRRPHVRLKVAGKGPLRSELEQLAVVLGLRDRVEFLGHLGWEALADAYRLCDAFVLPSKSEVQPMALLEAMRFAKPVVVTDHIFHEDFLGRDENCLVSRDDCHDLADRLVQLHDDPALRTRLGQAGHARVVDLAPDKVFLRVEETYSDVVRETHTPWLVTKPRAHHPVISEAR